MHRAGVFFVLLDHMHGLLRLRNAHSGPLQRGENVDSYQRISPGVGR